MVPVGQNFSRCGCSSFSFSAEPLSVFSALFLFLEEEPSLRALLGEGDTRGDVRDDPRGDLLGGFLPALSGVSWVDFGGLVERM